jgi:colanic acid biosynthesis protein WcaH
MAWMAPAEFAQVVRLTPLVSIDLILRDPEGKVLVGLRTNEPAKGLWFVPGGRIEKDERLADAFARILSVETGLSLPMARSRLMGGYEHFYDTNRFEQPGYGTHYVVIGRELRLDRRPGIKTDDQHSAVRWMSPEEILAAPDVHENTKAYFR